MVSTGKKRPVLKLKAPTKPPEDQESDPSEESDNESVKSMSSSSSSDSDVILPKRPPCKKQVNRSKDAGAAKRSVSRARATYASAVDPVGGGLTRVRLSAQPRKQHHT